MKRLIIAVMVCLVPMLASARQRTYTSCEQGNYVVNVAGSISTLAVGGAANGVGIVQASFPSCTVTVYLTGTQNLATIYSDSGGTPKSNPYTATSDGSGFFYADNGRYDVQISGANLPSPVTKGDILTQDLSTGTSLLATTVTYSATPTFAAGSFTLFMMTLTGNVTSSTITGSTTGEVVEFQLCQDGTGGRTFAWPGLFLRPPTIVSSASACTDASFYYDGTNWRQLALPGDSVGATSFANLMTFNGGISASSYNNVVEADMQAGADWCAKVTAADAVLGSGAGTIQINRNAGQTACAAAPTLSANHALQFTQGGIYPIAVGWTMANKSNWAVIGQPGTVISFTGSAGFTIDGSSGAANNINISDIIFSGNAGITNVATFKQTTRSHFTNVYYVNGTGDGLFCQFCLGDIFNGGGVTNNITYPAGVSFSTIPAVGMELAQIDPSHQSNNNTLNSPLLESITGGIGLKISGGTGNTIINPIAEGDGTGIQTVTASASGNSIVGPGDFEVNATWDVDWGGAGGQLIGLYAKDGSRLHSDGSGSATGTQVIGGMLQSLTIDTNVKDVQLSGMKYSVFSAGGTITDNGTNTSKTNVYNWNLNTYDAITFPGSSLSSISLTSTVATGTAPLVVASTTNVANLNASSLNGATFASPGAIGGTTPAAGTFTTATINTSIIPGSPGGVGIGNLANPFSALYIGSGVNITAAIQGTFAANRTLTIPDPGASASFAFTNPTSAQTLNNTTIGGSTPAAGTFTTLAASGQVTSTLSTGTAPLVIASTTPVANLTLSQHPQVEYCGATSGGTQACTKTVLTTPLIVQGDVTLNTATTQSITTLPFTNANYSCSGSDLTTATGIVSFNTYANASVTIQESGGANTDHLRYQCVGN